MQILLFGGTSEGRELAGWLASRRSCELWVSSVTDYGTSLVSDFSGVHTLTGAMSEPEIEQFIGEHALSCVIDATHPYAAHVSASIAQACEVTGVPLERVCRKDEPVDERCHICGDAHEAAEYLNSTQGNILLTTGSKELDIYTRAIDGFKDRLYVRVLPVESSIRACRESGIPAQHVIALQGPFSTQLNVALIREYDSSVLVTKASGKAGGFEEKLAAARQCGIESIVISRPLHEDGLKLHEMKQHLETAYGA
jgi:precorrin-6x reductase